VLATGEEEEAEAPELEEEPNMPNSVADDDAPPSSPASEPEVMVDIEGDARSNSEVAKGDQLEIGTIAESDKIPKSEPLDKDARHR